MSRDTCSSVPTPQRTNTATRCFTLALVAGTLGTRRSTPKSDHNRECTFALVHPLSHPFAIVRVTDNGSHLIHPSSRTPYRRLGLAAILPHLFLVKSCDCQPTNSLSCALASRCTRRAPSTFVLIECDCPTSSAPQRPTGVARLLATTRALEPATRSSSFLLLCTWHEGLFDVTVPWPHSA